MANFIGGIENDGEETAAPAGVDDRFGLKIFIGAGGSGWGVYGA
jgi:hypothetical protein